MNLSGARGWEYAYKKELENKLEVLRDALENGQTLPAQEFSFLCGQIRGIRLAIAELSDTRARFNVDDDADQRE